MFAIDYEDLGTPASTDTKQVTLEIDGVQVTVPEGTSLMRAAAIAEVKVPKLCATDTLKAFGSCRLCLVEIEGRKGYPASCTTTVAPGMKIKTQSDKLMSLRRGVIDLYVAASSDDGATPPATAHRHTDGWCAITGGYVIRGRYVYGDLCTGKLWSARFTGTTLVDDRPLKRTVPYLTSFGCDARGRVYAVSFSGSVFRLTPRAPAR